ncbi:MAG: hypothetical protein LBN10_10025 [Propionibacteriaceae bacterium]|jgi:hypothetical protein|nr:hypothetical protein [Propionibacteriaceae bacterium]
MTTPPEPLANALNVSGIEFGSFPTADFASTAVGSAALRRSRATTNPSSSVIIIVI